MRAAGSRIGRAGDRNAASYPRAPELIGARTGAPPWAARIAFFEQPISRGTRNGGGAAGSRSVAEVSSSDLDIYEIAITSPRRGRSAFGRHEGIHDLT